MPKRSLTPPGPWRAIAERLAAQISGDRGAQKRLALKVGVSEATMSRFLSGDYQPSADEVSRLASALGISVGELYGEQLSVLRTTSAAQAALPHVEAATRALASALASLRSEGEPAEEPANVLPFPDAPRSPDVDEPQDLHESEMEIVAYAAAGQDRHPEPVATGESIPVINHVYRKAQRGKWKVVKVVGDSMAPEYEPGDMVLIEPARDSTVRSGDVAYVMLNGECLLKVLAFRRDRDSGRLLELKLRSLNPAYPDIPVTDNDWFHVIGVEAYRIQRGRNFK